VGRPDPAGGEDRPERIECIDDRSLLVANHPHFLEIDADRRQIFRDIADVLVLGAAGQDLATDHQERGRDGLFGSGRICGCHDHLQENAPNDEPTQDGKHASSSSEPETSWRSGVCRLNAPTMAFAIGYESIAFIALENCGVAA